MPWWQGTYLNLEKDESAEMKFLRSVTGFTPPYISWNANQLNILLKLDSEDGGSNYFRNVGKTQEKTQQQQWTTTKARNQ
jgi:hypothetical protein